MIVPRGALRRAASSADRQTGPKASNLEKNRCWPSMPGYHRSDGLFSGLMADSSNNGTVDMNNFWLGERRLHRVFAEMVMNSIESEMPYHAETSTVPFLIRDDCARAYKNLWPRAANGPIPDLEGRNLLHSDCPKKVEDEIR